MVTTGEKKTLRGARQDLRTPGGEGPTFAAACCSLPAHPRCLARGPSPLVVEVRALPASRRVSPEHLHGATTNEEHPRVSHVDVVGTGIGLVSVVAVDHRHSHVGRHYRPRSTAPTRGSLGGLLPSSSHSRRASGQLS
jgi:hypothetical protein